MARISGLDQKQNSKAKKIGLSISDEEWFWNQGWFCNQNTYYTYYTYSNHIPIIFQSYSTSINLKKATDSPWNSHELSLPDLPAPHRGKDDDPWQPRAAHSHGRSNNQRSWRTSAFWWFLVNGDQFGDQWDMVFVGFFLAVNMFFPIITIFINFPNFRPIKIIR
jgi:hypothetical protein